MTIIINLPYLSFIPRCNTATLPFACLSIEVLLTSFSIFKLKLVLYISVSLSRYELFSDNSIMQAKKRYSIFNTLTTTHGSLIID